ncbi:cation transporter [Blastococcus sp. CT_GayMR19]|uniref:cation diffusion facilitator family transporter n=1 Tax=Blastococcus sp. CT_GayMR19 TaxID=2559608 RepID=UPI0010732CF0|nr:cation transporter [Blastococcus sp. CT_GayMR19]TFV79357.1 cation transporter [Blastococcus sp. CT_GayMR19]
MGTEALRKRGLRLAWFIVGWDVVEGTVAVTAGLLAGSIALVGFGIDSAIEVFAALVVIWQLRKDGKQRYTLALRLIALSFFLLAGYVIYKSVSDLINANEPDPSPVGIILAAVATVVMIPVAIAQKRTGEALGNQVLVAQSNETWVSNYLSISLLLGLGLNALFGWWWADPLVALLISLVAVREGWEAWREARESSEEATRKEARK